MLFKVAAQPTLAPLFFYVAVGTTGAVAFAARYISSHQDIVIRKQLGKDPWNQVTQGTNTKLMSFNQDFWAGRQTIPDPRAMFQEDIGSTASADAIKVAKAKAIRAAKAAKASKPAAV